MKFYLEVVRLERCQTGPTLTGSSSKPKGKRFPMEWILRTMLLWSAVAALHSTFDVDMNAHVDSMELDLNSDLNLDLSKPPKLLWVNTPKTGSAFCLTLQYDQCQKSWPADVSPDKVVIKHGCATIPGFSCDVERPKFHGPLDVSTDSARVVIVVRHPKSRIVSSYFDSKHLEGMEESDRKVLQAKEDEARLAKCGELTSRLRTEVYKYKKCTVNAELPVYGEITKGCVVRTLNGIWCYDVSKGHPTQEQVTFAVERLKKFHFVGIFEEWDEMIERFNAIRGHPLTENTPSATLHRARFRKGGYNELFDPASMQDFKDEFDQQIYDAAVSMQSRAAPAPAAMATAPPLIPPPPLTTDGAPAGQPGGSTEPVVAPLVAEQPAVSGKGSPMIPETPSLWDPSWDSSWAVSRSDKAASDKVLLSLLAVIQTFLTCSCALLCLI